MQTKSSLSQLTPQAVVVGAGPAGLTAAIALAQAGVDTVLVAPRTDPGNRTTALMTGSIQALDTLGAWSLCRDNSAPLRTLRVADDTGRLIRAPEARFEASELGLDAFGHNIENRHLVAALAKRAEELPITRVEGTAETVEIGDDHVTLHTQDGTRIVAPLVVAADGGKSRCRAAAGIETRQWTYPQCALTFNIRHTRPHQDTSTELHTTSGPFTMVPLPRNRSSIVCVVTPDEGDRLAQLDDEALAQEIERRSHSILGKISVEPSRGYFPLAVEIARSFGRNRIALVGESAHRIPPIGAQGLNLGLRDAAMIAELAADALRNGEELGGAPMLERYDAKRQTDVSTRTFAVDLLNRTLLSGLLPLQGARGLGVYLLNRVGPLRRAVMQEGIAPAAAQPRLMRGEALV